MADLFHNLGIDWKLLAFQAINFFILLYVLNRFLFRPLFKIIDERKKKIEDGLKFSDQAEKDLKELQEKRGHILSEAQRKADLEMENAKKMAEEKKKKIIDDAETKVRELEIMARAQAEVEKQKIVDSSKREVLDLAFAVAQNVLGKKVGEKEDENFIKKAIKKI